MLTGMAFCNSAPDRTVCRTVEDYYMTIVGDYKVHATSVMSEIQYNNPRNLPESISSTIFINDASTKLSFPGTVATQNYLTTRYLGRAPLEYYGPKTPAGRDQFYLFFENGFTDYKWRKFGTDGSSRGNNVTANDMFTYQR